MWKNKCDNIDGLFTVEMSSDGALRGPRVSGYPYSRCRDLELEMVEAKFGFLAN
jgi:hypothetical protein